MYVFAVPFIALCFWFLRWNAEPDIHLLSQAGAVTDV
jgi:hypothetical protein